MTEGHLKGSEVVTGPMEVRVTPHSSSLSWDGIGARQTKAKADGGCGGWGGADEKES